jgi:hypothetical protein
LRIIAAAALCGVVLAAPPARAADVLYDNGPVNGTMEAWTIGPYTYGYSVADSFTLLSAETVTGRAIG